MGYILISSLLILSIFSLNVSLKSQKYFSIIVWLSIVIVMGLSYGLPDELMYKTFFYNSLNFSLENAFDYKYSLSNGIGRDPGYMVFAYLARVIGMDFIEFKFFLYLIGVSALYIFAYRQSKFVLVFLCMYLIYPMAMDSIQQRNYVVEIFLFIAFYIYCNCETYKRYLLFILTMLIAATFHSSALAFLPFILFDKVLKSKCKYIIHIYLISCLCMPLYHNYIKSQWFLVGLLFSETDTGIAHYGEYMDNTVINTDLKWYIIVILLYICMAICNYLKNTERYVNLTDMEKRYISKVKTFVLYNFCFFPLYSLFSDIAVRFPRNTSLLIFMSITILVGKSNLYYKYFLLLMGISIAVLIGLCDLYSPNLRVNVDILMNQNYLFEFLGF